MNSATSRTFSRLTLILTLSSFTNATLTLSPNFSTSLSEIPFSNAGNSTGVSLGFFATGFGVGLVVVVVVVVV